MKIKTAELDGPQLAWAVGMAEGDRVYRMRIARPIDWKGEGDNRWVVKAQVPNVGWFADYVYQPHTDPLQAWPIIDREGIGFYKGNSTKWWAHPYGGEFSAEGPTSLVAAMRCYVVSELGEEVEIPEELLS